MKFQFLILTLSALVLSGCANMAMSEAERMQLERAKADAQKAESDKSFKELDRVTKE
ncbi:hypothetical protein [Thiomicrospira pelophila]|uniref:hypothetical protein n=1 Tax=Thiomicrospira pelophila TaxID=934 RepID=UPI000A8BB005|nr:hypothetical protein [Thiomicrospira pelophila]